MTMATIVRLAIVPVILPIMVLLTVLFSPNAAAEANCTAQVSHHPRF